MTANKRFLPMLDDYEDPPTWPEDGFTAEDIVRAQQVALRLRYSGSAPATTSRPMSIKDIAAAFSDAYTEGLREALNDRRLFDALSKKGY